MMRPSDDHFNRVASLPYQQFMYTVDQVALMLQAPDKWVREELLYYTGRDFSKVQQGRLKATNIAPRDTTPVWRVAEGEFIRWCKFKRITLSSRVTPNALIKIRTLRRDA